MTNCPSCCQVTMCRRQDNHDAGSRGYGPPVSRYRRAPATLDATSGDLLAYTGIMAVPFEEDDDRLLLPREPTRQCVDLRLTFYGQGCELGSITLEERAGIGSIAAAIVRSAG